MARKDYVRLADAPTVVSVMSLPDGQALRVGLRCRYCDFTVTAENLQMRREDALLNHSTDKHLEEAIAAEKAGAQETTEDRCFNRMIALLSRPIGLVLDGSRRR